MVPSKCLCPSDPSQARALQRTEENVELGREVKGSQRGPERKNRERAEVIGCSNGVEQVCQKMESLGN